MTQSTPLLDKITGIIFVLSLAYSVFHIGRYYENKLFKNRVKMAVQTGWECLGNETGEGLCYYPNQSIELVKLFKN